MIQSLVTSGWRWKTIGSSRRRVSSAAIAAPFLLIALSTGLSAGSFTFSGVGTAAGNPINVSTTIVTGTDSLTITLTNYEVNPTSVAQNISGMFFTLNAGNPNISNLAATGTLIDISVGSPYTLTPETGLTSSSTPALHWTLTSTAHTSSTSNLYLNDLTGGQPKQTVIGPPDSSGLYSAAGGSITGSTHNPFWYEAVTFTVSDLGVTSNTVVTSVTFQFNTATGDTFPGSVPEPATMGLLGASLVGLSFFLRKRKRHDELT